MTVFRLRWIRIFLVVVLLLCLVIVALPYAIPLSRQQGPVTPYADGQFFTYDKSWIHYRVLTPQITTDDQDNTLNGKVLFVHGFGGSSYSFEANAKAVVDAGYVAVLVDLPGFGYSSRYPEEDHSQTYRAERLWELLQWLDTQNTDISLFGMSETPWHLVGHSMGAGTVATMADQQPSRAASLLFIDGALLEAKDKQNSLVRLPFIQRWIQIMLEYVFITPDRIKGFLASAYGQEPTAQQIEGYLKPLQVPGTARSVSALFNSNAPVPEKLLRKLRTPSMAIWGGEDRWVPVDQIYELSRIMPYLRGSIITHSGHCPMETHPEMFNPLLLGWLTESVR